MQAQQLDEKEELGVSHLLARRSLIHPKVLAHEDYIFLIHPRYSFAQGWIPSLLFPSVAVPMWPFFGLHSDSKNYTEAFHNTACND